jgi:glucokinase
VILAGDIGGTKTLLAIFERDAVRFEQRYASGEFADFASLLERFLADANAALGRQAEITGACFGIAGPVVDERVRVTNLPWEIDARALEHRCGIARIRLINDFAAAAYGIDALRRSDFVTLQEGDPIANAPRLVIGAGTGLGVAYMISDGALHRVVPGEGGHAGFAPANEEQAALWRHLYGKLGRVEIEHVVSGDGLERIYMFLRDAGQAEENADVRAAIDTQDGAAAISEAALESNDSLANAALDLFVACYGAAAGDYALAVVARGGVYIAGGIAPKILPRLAAGGFVAAFNAKGSFAELTRKMPVHVITNERLGLIGAWRCAESFGVRD